MISLFLEAVEAITAATVRCCVAMVTLLGTESKQSPRAKQGPAGEGNMPRIEITSLGFFKARLTRV